jgi:uncharacterized protein
MRLTGKDVDESTRTVAADERSRPRRAHGTGPLAGTSLKHEHLVRTMENGLQEGFFEVHVENYMHTGGPQNGTLAPVRQNYALSIHDVSMSIEGLGPHDTNCLCSFCDLMDRNEPALTSEHLAWSSNDRMSFKYFLPVSYATITAYSVYEHINEGRVRIGRPIVFDNRSAYIAFASSTIPETEFIRTVAQRTGCSLLQEINDIFGWATNCGYSVPAYFEQLPCEHVGEFRLNGNNKQRGDVKELPIIDSHDSPTSETVTYDLGSLVVQIGPRPTFIDRASNLPEGAALWARAVVAQRFMSSIASFEGA